MKILIKFLLAAITVVAIAFAAVSCDLIFGGGIEEDDFSTSQSQRPKEDSSVSEKESESVGTSVSAPPEGHSHIFTVEQHGAECDPNGYLSYKCDCGETFVVKNYRSHSYVSGVCVYCGVKNLTSVSGLVFNSDVSLDGSGSSSLAGVKVSLVAKDGSVEYETVSDSDGRYTFDAVEIKIYVLIFVFDGYNTIEIDFDPEEQVEKDVYMDVKQDSVLNGRVTIADEDTDYSNNRPLEGATVTIQKVTGTNALEYTVNTRSDGTYSFAGLTSGRYKITVVKTGFVVLVQYITVDVGVNTITNSVYELIEDNGDDEPGVVKGMIYDAAQQGNVGVKGLTLRIRAGLNNLTGEVLLTVTTGENGKYTVSGLETGNYTVSVKDERTLDNENLRYSDAVFNIKIIQGHTIENQNGSVSSGVFFGQIRVVLSWGNTPADLDSHLSGYYKTNKVHVYYSNMSYSANGNKLVNLDRDDTDSYGPETVTVYSTDDIKFSYKVHDFTNKGSSYSTALANSGATVEVYFGNTLKYTYYVPQSAGTVWTVFEYDGSTGILTPVDGMSYASDSGSI